MSRAAWRGRSLRLALAVCVAVLAGCARPPAPDDARNLSEAELAQALTDAQARDGRAAFTALVCPRVMALGRDCGDVLHAVTEATAAPPRWPLATARPRLVFVGGLFAECLERWVPAFKDTIEALVAAGYDARTLTVAGRGTAVENAQTIAGAIAALPSDGRGLVVFGYSKGAVDVLEALVRHPDAMRAVSAMVTIAGAQNGSHLAESRADFYAGLGASLPFAGCARGTGAEVVELRRDARQAWWARFRGMIPVPVYSLVALPRPQRISPFLAAGAREIARFDPRNDGNIVWRDAIAPGSTLLGFVDADHWTIALPITAELPVLSPWFRDDVPRALLFEAAAAIAMSKSSASR